ncbi:penicillin-binding transpeptidase domain-containing protein [Sulfurimonas sp.]|jgi:beta-lactamase class D|uniref:penicillin-binding transpeptidase domain-containing protein n=1 Tax=Sulfurimonas sp. TaxID=2022749 RepID=UPI0025D1DA14|nr:penicillin-binding transpeptidase domain-containing protein [Sulfurimonas sp.]MCK9474175.1 penicillin-binding transpeptidase domain-containing protein [Sulfurimonas sp.]
MSKLLILFILILPLFAVEPNFGKYDGSAVILDLNSSKKIVFGSRANERVSPCSTFKILSSMIALENRVVKDEDEVIKWDGIKREYSAWNQDHTMRSAIAVSAIWFYQELASRIGEQRMKEYVKKVHYGNADTSLALTSFWLGGGSLKISPSEQVDFLSRFVHNELPFSLHTIQTVKEIMALEKHNDYQLAGKTGSCGGIGWFVGFIKNHDNTTVFAFNIKGDGANGAEAKRVALEYLKRYKTT